VSSSVAICPHCSTAADFPIVCARCGWRWYANPKPAAGTLLERIGPDGKAQVLLLKRAVEPGFGAWDLPAGYLEAGESAEEGAIRETREESGIDVQLVRLAGVYTSRDGNAISTIYLAHPVESETVLTDAESNDHAWIGRDHVAVWLPRMAFRSMATALEDWGAERYGQPRNW
jgi:ADP-ribose pyrophosphatase YjhB (NUDIX family)